MESESSSLIECPSCGELVSQGNICEECGSGLQKDESIPEELSTSFGEVKEPDPQYKEEQSKIETVVEVESEVDEHHADKVEASECPDFVVEFNDAREFVEGRHSSFNFKISPHSSRVYDCKEIELSINCDLFAQKSQKVFGGRWVRPVDISIGCNPSESGIDIPMDVTLSYRKYGKRLCYSASVLWTCYPAEDSSRKMFDNLNINVEGVSSDLASDQNVNILSNMKMPQGVGSAEQMRRMKETGKNWIPVYLREMVGSGVREIPAAPVGANVDCLTLIFRDYRLHLLAMEKVSIGRHGSNTLATRILEEIPPGTKSDPNRRISRYHATIRRQRNGLELMDGGNASAFDRRKPSAGGTYLNGERLDSNKPVIIPNGHKGNVSLSNPDPENKMVFGFTCRALERSSHEDSWFQSLGIPHHTLSTPGAILRRCDAAKEVFLCVWDYLSFKPNWEVFPDTMQFLRANGAFYLMIDEEAVPLNPGTRIPFLRDEMSVRPWSQIGLT
ncbi:MAG: FHA domain-containing protein [Puniceicoccaceae bacterium]